MVAAELVVVVVAAVAVEFGVVAAAVELVVVVAADVELVVEAVEFEEEMIVIPLLCLLASNSSDFLVVLDWVP